MNFLCQGFCYIKDIRIYIVIQNNNIIREITRLQKNMVALKNLYPSENLPATAPVRIKTPLIVIPPPPPFPSSF